MRARALENGSSTMQSTALCLLLRYLRRPKRATRCFFMDMPATDGATPPAYFAQARTPCGTRRFTTRVAQVRAAAAPRRRLEPPNAEDCATSSWHWAVARLKESQKRKMRGLSETGCKPLLRHPGMRPASVKSGLAPAHKLALARAPVAAFRKATLSFIGGDRLRRPPAPPVK